MSTIRSHMNAWRGRYAVEENYREVVTQNMTESAHDFLMAWNEHLAMFKLFVVMTVSC